MSDYEQKALALEKEISNIDKELNSSSDSLSSNNKNWKIYVGIAVSIFIILWLFLKWKSFKFLYKKNTTKIDYIKVTIIAVILSTVVWIPLGIYYFKY